MFPDLTGPKLLVTKKTATLKVLTKINLRQKNGLYSLAQEGLSAQRAIFTEKIHKPPLGVNIIDFELNGFNALKWVPKNFREPKNS